MSADTLALGLIWFVAFLFSSTCHEAAHAWAAKRGGDETAYSAGQVSLNPVPHMMREPFGMLVMPWLSYIMGGWMMGWASAPYDPYWARRHPRRSAWMALAGPAANFALAISAAVLIHIGILMNVFRLTGQFSDRFDQLVGGTSLGHTKKLQDVQCETCHGPGSKHVAEEGSEEPPAVHKETPASTCTVCHTEQHSDTFQYEAYLRDILGPGHGPSARKKLGDGPTGHELRTAALARAKVAGKAQAKKN